jgi:hypothetical protein
MLSVGRELKINDKRVVCRTCSWEGAGAELSTGLIRLTPAPIFFYVYRCPECGSVDLTRTGKLLQFRLRPSWAQEVAQEVDEPVSSQADQAMSLLPRTRVEDSKR